MVSFTLRLSEANYKVEKGKSRESLMLKEQEILKIQLTDAKQEKDEVKQL